MKIKLIIFSLVITGVVFSFRDSKKIGGERARLKVRRQNVERVLIERGLLRPQQYDIIQVLSSGTILDIKAHGSYVRKGEVVVRLDNSEQQESIDELKLDMKHEELKLTITQQEYEMVDNQEKNDVGLKKTKLDYAVLILKEEMSYPLVNNSRKLAIKRQLVVLDLEQAIEELGRKKSLYEKGFLSKTSLEPHERKVATTREKLKEAQLNITVAKKGIVEERRIELEQAVLRRKSDYERSAKQRLRKLQQVQDRLTVLVEKMRENKYNLKNLEYKLEHSTAISPIEGYMNTRTYRDWRSGGNYTQYAAGIDVDDGDVVADVINSKKMKIDVIFNEADFSYLEKDMQVRVELPAYPGKMYKGSVKRVGAIGKDRNKWLEEVSGQSGVTMYKAEIEFDYGDEKLHPGMSAMVSFVVERQHEALVVERSAVWQEDDTFYVFKKDVKTEVLGRYVNEFYFEILDGLQDGDEVMAVEAK
ncbi:MAG: HlyD family efflux transporter periplasmic adaptor subunit [Lentisphaeraceae bacterium]|nr:HlyD family efflux transporter periplasmic adaptor subunit [Lentisphaeraceae bacterium]